MFTQPRDLNNKNKAACKKTSPNVMKQKISYQLVSKNIEMMKTKEMLMLDQNLLRNHLYNTFVLLVMTEQNDMIHNIGVELHHEVTIITTTIHKTDIALHLEIGLVMTRVLLLHKTLDHDLTTINAILSLSL